MQNDTRQSRIQEETTAAAAQNTFGMVWQRFLVTERFQTIYTCMYFSYAQLSVCLYQSRHNLDT